MYIDIDNNGEKSIFIKADSVTKFGLRCYKEIYGNEILQREEEEESDVSIKEKQMHKPFITYLLNEPSIRVHAKTINANKSTPTKKGVNEWEHPDIIGVKFASEMYKNAVDTMRITGEQLYDIYSFELKLSISTHDICNKYFQAVSNSSWANYGYLVVSDYDDSNIELRNKLDVLYDQFGIGLIHLKVDLRNPEDDLDNMMAESDIILYAKKKRINYKFLDRFIEKNNSDIDSFFKNVNEQSQIRGQINYSFCDEPFPYNAN